MSVKEYEYVPNPDENKHPPARQPPGGQWVSIRQNGKDKTRTILAACIGELYVKQLDAEGARRRSIQRQIDSLVIRLKTLPEILPVDPPAENSTTGK